MTIRVLPPAALLAAGLALSGCIDVECPAEFARPTSRERYCGHTGDVAMPTTYQVSPNARVLAPSAYTPVTGPPVSNQPMVQAAPQQPVTVAPVPAPSQPTQIR
jgi:hypothetical protein